MIVRVMSEGQYEVGDDIMGRLNELDHQAMEALDREDEAELDEYLREMGEIVRGAGQRLADDDLRPSDIIVPSADFTLEETRKLVTEEGFIADVPV